MKDSIMYGSFWTTVIFIVLKLVGLLTASWWWLLVTIFFPPVAWVAGIVWVIQLIVGA